MSKKKIQQNKNGAQALFLIDIEPLFVTDETRRTLSSIENTLRDTQYDWYVIGEYSQKNISRQSHEKKVWETKEGRLPKHEETLSRCRELIPQDKIYGIVKTTHSLFGNDETLSLFLKKNNIEGVDIVGFETHDCVLATAFDCIDRDLPVRVLENGTSSKNPLHHRAGLSVLRALSLTDNGE